MKKQKNILLLFIKNARLGTVKTRLAATIGSQAALQIYQILLTKSRESALLSNSDRWLWYSDEITEKDEWSSDFFTKKVQSSGNLGDRMSDAFRQAFEAGAEKVVIMGSDCPEITGEIIDAAFNLLAANNVVIGPTFDGGYYLLGMNQYYPGLFDNVEWSTENVFPTTIEICANAGLSVGLLPQLSDIDHEEDWLGYQRRVANRLL
jgi:rSAM/selenodomain-associated transferase 1